MSTTYHTAYRTEHGQYIITRTGDCATGIMVGWGNDLDEAFDRLACTPFQGSQEAEAIEWTQDCDPAGEYEELTAEELADEAPRLSAEAREALGVTLLRPDPKVVHLDASEWAESLGHCEDWEEEEDGAPGDWGSVDHPPVSTGALDDHTDEVLIERLVEEAEAGPSHTRAIRRAVEYARRAWEASQAIHEALERAIQAHADGDDAGCVEALKEAADIENEWGDDPTARAVCDALLLVPLRDL